MLSCVQFCSLFLINYSYDIVYINPDIEIPVSNLDTILYNCITGYFWGNFIFELIAVCLDHAFIE